MSRIEGEDPEISLFMSKFKQLKRKHPPADLSGVTDFRALPHLRQVTRVTAAGCTIAGMNKPCDWLVHRLDRFPGVHVVSNALTSAARRCLVHRCLSDLPARPHISNLDGLTGGRGSADKVWQSANKPQSSQSERQRLEQLRWVTLGYHYDWTNKIYKKELHNDMPADIGYLSRYVISCVLGEQQYFQAEAAIVNFYHIGTSLSGHTDHSEFDLTAPLLSISLGLPCVFMIGGLDRSQEPEALYLRCGDMLIMSGRERLSYHAVPRILQTIPENGHTCSAENAFRTGDRPHSPLQFGICEVEPERITDSRDEKKDSLYCTGDTQPAYACPRYHQIFSNLELWEKPHTDWLSYAEYLSRSRININVRQMFHEGRGPDDYIWPPLDSVVSG